MIILLDREIRMSQLARTGGVDALIKIKLQERRARRRSGKPDLPTCGAGPHQALGNRM
jgi:hypothetical protein